MTENTQNSNTPSDNHIDIQVIQGALSLIDAAIKRGAYQPNEISSVGIVRDKLDGAVNSYTEANNQVQNNTQPNEKVS